MMSRKEYLKLIKVDIFQITETRALVFRKWVK